MPPIRHGMRQNASSAIPTHIRSDVAPKEAIQRMSEKQNEMALHTLTGRAMKKMQIVPLPIKSRQSTQSMTLSRHPALLHPPNKCLDMQSKDGNQDMDVLSCGLESWLCVLIGSGHHRLGVCGVTRGSSTDGHNDTLRQSPSSRHAAPRLSCSAASGLADLEVDDRSGDSEWIRQRSFEFSASRFATLCFIVFNTARRSSQISISSRHHSNTLASPFHSHRVHFPLPLLPTHRILPPRLLHRHCLLIVFHGCRLAPSMLCLFDRHSHTNDAVECCRLMELRSRHSHAAMVFNARRSPTDRSSQCVAECAVCLFCRCLTLLVCLAHIMNDSPNGDAIWIEIT
ncbi:hypothetical protein BLNAU_9918 [Blattamonas nauphoetae]|uniref:Uncharacterized protein n=1 Tax=Blattamonas nauphoetae TaxID=2049346 RepID=A0ABQ9XUN4_9EUKA|nr:hypothetical protein BLNAU_9918 [Blattamonas nauphoetae]